MRKLTAYVRQHHIGLIALFVALGGSAYAAATIGSDDVVNNSLTGGDIRGRLASPGRPFTPGTLTGADIKANSIGGAKINESSLRGLVAGNGRVRQNRLPLTPGAGYVKILEFPGFGKLEFRCTPSADVYYWKYTNTSAGTVNGSGGLLDAQYGSQEIAPNSDIETSFEYTGNNVLLFNFAGGTGASTRAVTIIGGVFLDPFSTPKRCVGFAQGVLSGP
jgi:hypothetical protein